MLEVICDDHCPLFGQGECEMDLFPGSRPPGRRPRHMNKKNAGEFKHSFLRFP